MAVQTKNARRFVYLIFGGGLTKIGASHDPIGRMATFQPMSPAILELRLVIWASAHSWLESELHSRFRKQKSHGEWYALTDIDTENIAHEFRDWLVPMQELEELREADRIERVRSWGIHANSANYQSK